MILSEFAFLCGEDDKSILNHELNSDLSAECLCSVSMQAGRLLHWLLARPALPLECSHLLMDAVIGLGSLKFHSLIWTFGRIIHPEQIAPALCLQIESVSLMHYPTSE